MRILVFFISVLWTCCANPLLGQFYQGSNMEFGKNRVQYREFEWFYYPTDHFEVYYYTGGENLAQYVLVSAEKNKKDIEKFFDYSIDDKIQILSYAKQSEFRQSNIGISNDDQYNIGGAARIMGDKMFVYYEDDHRSLEKQIRESLSRVVFNNMMYGGDWKDVLKSSTLLSMPKWYEEGVISYAAKSSHVESEAFMKDWVQRKKLGSINRLDGKEAKLVGTAFWQYIADAYGENVLPNILYMTRLSRNIDSGFLFVLGLTTENVSADFLKFYKEKYGNRKSDVIPGTMPAPEKDAPKKEWKEWKKMEKQMGELPVKYKKKYVYSQFKLSPDKNKMAFVTNEMGQYKIWVYDYEKDKLKRIVKKEYRLDRLVDESFPVLAWHPSSEVLTYIFEKRGRAFIGNYEFGEKRRIEKELFRIEKVIDINYSSDGKKIVFTGVNKGQSDIYVYQVIGNNQEQITFDLYDDMNARFIENDRRIIFASNRPDDTLRKERGEIIGLNKDVYIYNYESRSEILERVTNTPSADEHHPSEYKTKHFTFLSNELGNDNRYLATIDSAIARIDTTIHYRYFTTSSLLSNFPRRPLDYQFNGRSGDYTLLFKKASRPVVYIGNREEDVVLNGQFDTGQSKSAEGNALQLEYLAIKPDSLGPDEVDIYNYEFEDERKSYTYEKESVRIQEIKPDGTKEELADTAQRVVQIPKSRGYRLNFATDYVLSQVDNSFTNAFYQKFTSPSSINPGISGLIKFGLSDLFEDYKLVGGVRLSFDLQNNDFGVSLENLKRRVDKKIMLQRQAQTTLDNFNYFKIHTHSFSYQWKYPFTELSSVRVTGILRQDRIVTSSIDPVSLVERTAYNYQVGVRAEYVFDNTINKGLNLYNGTRYKVWVERYQRPDIFNQKTDFNIAGFDFRHYKKIHRDLIAAIRFSGSTTFGRYKLAHYLGGVDNWLFQRVDNSLPALDTAVFYHQTFMGPMRGFYVNSRNGNSFALMNAEIRWPVFKYLMKKPIKSDFVDNFQIVGFFDAGSAWTGKSPYGNDNLFNQTTVSQNPITVQIENNKEPIIYGYGFGLRSRLLGYFVRADWAWGIDDGRTLPRVFYLSLNLDF